MCRNACTGHGLQGGLAACYMRATVQSPGNSSPKTNPGFPRKPSLAPLPLLLQCAVLFSDGRGRALPPVRWKLSFTVPCQEGNGAWATSQTPLVVVSKLTDATSAPAPVPSPQTDATPVQTSNHPKPTME